MYHHDHKYDIFQDMYLIIFPKNQVLVDKKGEPTSDRYIFSTVIMLTIFKKKNIANWVAIRSVLTAVVLEKCSRATSAQPLASTLRVLARSSITQHKVSGTRVQFRLTWQTMSDGIVMYFNKCTTIYLIKLSVADVVTEHWTTEKFGNHEYCRTL